MKKIKLFIASHLDDLLFFAGVIAIATGLFLSPYPFLGWIGLGAGLIFFSIAYGSAS